MAFLETVTHFSPEKKTRIEAFWMFPTEELKNESAVFHFSVVKNFKTFWADVEAPVRVKSREEGSRNVK